MNEREEHLARSVRSAAAENNDDNLPVVWIVEQMAIKLREAEERNRRLEAALLDACDDMDRARRILQDHYCRKGWTEDQIEHHANWGMLETSQFRKLLATAPPHSDPAESGTYSDHIPDVPQEDDMGRWPAPTPDGGEGALDDPDNASDQQRGLDSVDVLVQFYYDPDNEPFPEQVEAATRFIRTALREPRVPEAVRRLPEGWRATAQCIQDQRFGKVASAEIRRLRQCADDFDRALAQSEQGRAPTSEELHEKRREQRDKYRPSEGWKLVPVEPTEEMLSQGSRANRADMPTKISIRSVWENMLNAAPQPDTQEGE